MWKAGALLVALTLAAGTAGAEDERSATRLVELPHAGVSVRIPDRWKVTQRHGGVVLFATDERSTVQLAATAHRPGGLRDGFERGLRHLRERSNLDVKVVPLPVWGAAFAAVHTAPTTTAQLTSGVVIRDDDSGLSLSASTPVGDAEARRTMQRILRSIDLRRYAKATRFIDWDAGWRLDLPEGWLHTGPQRFSPPNNPFAFVHVGRKPLDPASVFRRGTRLELEVVKKDGTTTHASPTAGPLAGRPLRIEHTTRSGWTITTSWLDDDAASKRAIAAAAASFRPDTEAGPRHPFARDRLPRSDAPPLRFTLPEGWRLGVGDGEDLASLRGPGDVRGRVHTVAPRDAAPTKKRHGRIVNRTVVIDTHEVEGVGGTRLRASAVIGGVAPGTVIIDVAGRDLPAHRDDLTAWFKTFRRAP